MKIAFNKNFFAYAVCFITGMVILILELISFRLFAPYFGNSAYVIGILINTILLALALGYYIGGYTADKIKSNKLPYFVIFIVAIYLLIIFASYANILQYFSNLSTISGVFIAAIIMFFIPTAFLAFIPPYFIKILATKQTIGTISGRIFSISTFGSIFGGLLTTFILIPSIGSRSIFLITIILLIITSIFGLARYSKMFYLLFLFLVIPFFISPSATGSNIIYQAESEHNIITVYNESGTLYLRLNQNKTFHSISLDSKTKLSYEYTDYFLIPHMILEAENTLILGNAAGTIMTQTTYFFDTNIDAVELDPKLTDVGEKYFNLRGNVFHQDARNFLIKNKKKYDIINIDISSGNFYIPFHLVTLEFFMLINNSLNENGILIINILPPFFNTELGDYYLNTIIQVFPNSYFSGDQLYAFKSNISRETIIQKVDEFKAPQDMDLVIYKFKLNFKKIGLEPSDKYFTDDYAPIEKLTFEVMKR